MHVPKRYKTQVLQQDQKQTIPLFISLKTLTLTLSRHFGHRLPEFQNMLTVTFESLPVSDIYCITC